MCDTWPRRPLGENVFSSRQTTTFLIWSTTSLPSKSNHGFQNRLLGQQGVKSYVKLEARVITNCVSEAKCSLRAGGSQSRGCAILAWGQEGRAPHHFPKHPVATQYQGESWSRRSQEPFAVWGWSLRWRHALMLLLLLLCSVKPKFTQAQFHLVAMMFSRPWNLLLDWNLYCSQKKF